ncbi:NAD-dependent epimerase/dehydratase family protein [Nitriliruptor alkaliphilus]|uniref:NAD-dependent epimerase/dehydratase family protein n=1 Tax=Nitriliruptor alkaliphilus TaxID=427918 RepID=UPI0006965E94|nr:NAD-dependent epimerase/dehydratase family protein [Nitriliruptor alkaliphilus]
MPSATTAPVLVTGGAGFIGSHLVDRLLAEGNRVVVVDDLSTGHRDNLAAATAAHPDALVFEQVDICSPELTDVVARHQPSVIFHLAAQMSVAVSVDDPVADAVTNVVGTVRVLAAAGLHGVAKVVFTSSGGAIYGEVPREQLPLTEEHGGPGLSPYGAAKRAGEEYVRTFATLHGFAWSAVAPANVYGPRQDPAGEGGVIARFTQRMLDGEPCVINGDGSQTRDFVYVADVVDAFVRAWSEGDGERFNAGTGRATSVNDLFDALAAATGHDGPAEHGPARLGDVMHNVISPAKAARQLGWEPRTSLADGLATTVAWARGEHDGTLV